MLKKKALAKKGREFTGRSDGADAQEPIYKKVKQGKDKAISVEVSRKKPAEEDLSDKANLDLRKLNKLYNALLSRPKDPEQATKGRESIARDIMKITEPIITKIVHKRDGSKILQACLKHGDQAVRKRVVDPFMHKSNFIDLIKSKYGHFLAIKFLKYLNNEQQKQVLNHIYNNIEALVIQLESAKTVDSYLGKLGKKNQIDQALKHVITTKNDNPTSNERIENAAARIAERGLYNYAIPQLILAHALRVLVEAERGVILEGVKEAASKICNKKSGAILVCQCFNYWDAKDKRTVLKNMKATILEHLLEESSFAFLPIIKAIKCVDDTVMLNKTLFAVLKKNLDQIMKHLHNQEIFLAVYDTKSNYLSDYVEIQDAHSTSKKDDAVRREELVAYIEEDLVNYFTFEMQEKLKDRSLSKLAYLVMKEIIVRNNSAQFSFVEKVIDVIAKDYRKVAKDNQESQALLTHPITHRLVKSFVIESGSCPEDSRSFYTKNLQKILEIILQETAVLINTKAIFIIIAFIEFTEFKDEVLQAVRSVQHTISEKSNKAGYEIIKKYL